MVKGGLFVGCDLDDWMARKGDERDLERGLPGTDTETDIDWDICNMIRRLESPLLD